jgi:ABC-type multidrug transport system ATPase subunit
MTVEEAITLSANLKLNQPKEFIEEAINSTIIELGLDKIRNSLIGNAQQKCISSGERKRVAIGVELVTNPSVIVLDEPTSGLDSFTALSLMALLHSLAQKNNKTIVSTIH